MGGVVSVSSYPEARRQGNVKNMFINHFQNMKKENIVVSALHAFKDSFYESLG